MRLSAISLLFSSLLVASPTLVAASLERGATIDKDEQVYTVNADGTWSMERQLEVRINEARLVNALAQQSFSYNATLETLEVSEAYTEKPDGSRIVVAPDRIREQQETGSPEVAMFQDMRVKVAIFPQVAAGDRLVVHLRQRQVHPMMAGQFQDLEVPQSFPIRQSRVVVDMPAAMPLYADARGYRGKVVDTAPGRRRYEYSYVEHAREQPDAAAVAFTDYGDRLALSSMPDYAALAAAYRKGMAGKVEVTPAVRALQQRITAGIQGQREQALALGDWVRRNVRYVAVYVGDGGVVPHAADQVLAARYGDCKDHQVLLEALLASSGIPSTAALISSGSAFQLTRVPTWGVLNHVINYVPSLDLFIDATADNVAPGYLPQGDMGKPVVLVATGAIARTPSIQPDSIVVDTDFTLDDARVQKFRQTRTMRGAAAEAGRTLARNAADPAGQNLHIDKGSLEGRGDQYLSRVEGDIPVSSSDASRITLTPSLVSGDPLFMQVMTRDVMLQVQTPQHDFPCTSHDIEETTHIRLPRGYRLDKLPAALDLHAGQLDYLSQASQGNGEVVLKRRYHDHPHGGVCPVDEVKERVALHNQIVADLLAQLTLVAE